MQLSRRAFIGSAGLLTAGTLAGVPLPTGAEERFELSLSEGEWRKRLTAQQYAILRRSQTERPYSSPLNEEHRKGVFLCAGCRLPLFSSGSKFDSGTGWPSFWKPLPNAVRTSTDYLIGLPRTEVHCRRCGGHLGHVFDDGPRPTGKRYCMNGAAMLFRPLA
ncbi:peptide-methionine (R)-S-oxide reductase MsrB [Rhizorhapis suberifaciens]|uniref:peptide-methionine (R)-S-oxide reductase n=1 Tax=Rhizorhapis suberifaciens TaxID=13656 RepID=A0A840HTN8_9SPHN|nr:peptide-methionine (R)-S-oxide reductase MsrB [Rhizorhapis suberifaciens]MBB4641061.1 peptide-methionine (R)-S-oxide reductase [Rhizorhapis suberifaciens]